jgi:hypothetical protein
MQKRAKSIVAAVGVMLIAASCGVCRGPAGSASIVGYWTFKSGVVDIRVSGPGFDGVVVRQPQSGRALSRTGTSCSS